MSAMHDAVGIIHFTFLWTNGQTLVGDVKPSRRIPIPHMIQDSTRIIWFLMFFVGGLAEHPSSSPAI